MGGIHKHIFEHVYLDVSETWDTPKMPVSSRNDALNHVILSCHQIIQTKLYEQMVVLRRLSLRSTDQLGLATSWSSG